MNGLAICAGIGGLEIGLRLLWPGYRTVCHVERESFAAATLVARMGEQALDQAPVWDDLSTFDGKPWRGRVDCIAGGIPCQPFSLAGKQRGLADERWLGSDLLRVVDEVRPRIIVLENVPGFAVAGGLHSILGGLEAIAPGGWRSEWLCLPASAVGAPHKRARLFGLFVADTHGERQRREGDAADPQGEQSASARRQVGDWPPGPGDSDGWREWIAAGGPPPTLESGVRGSSDGTPEGLQYANDRLRCLGNAVVPLQAAAAVGELARRLSAR